MYQWFKDAQNSLPNIHVAPGNYKLSLQSVEEIEVSSIIKYATVITYIRYIVVIIVAIVVFIKNNMYKNL